MKKIRIGNTIAFTWNIKVSGEAYDLTGRALKLYASTPGFTFEVSDMTVSGNAVSGKIYAGEQKRTGIYSFTLVENAATNDMLTIDCCNAFQLVDRECKEGCSPDGELSVTSDSAVCRISPVVPEIGANGHWFIGGLDTGTPAFMEAGMSAYDLAVTQGFRGTLTDWLTSLRLGGDRITVLADAFNFREPSSLDPPQTVTEEGSTSLPAGSTFKTGRVQMEVAGGFIAHAANGYYIVINRQDGSGNEIIVRNTSGNAIKSIRFEFEQITSSGNARLTPDSGIYADTDLSSKSGVWVSGSVMTDEVKFTINPNVYIAIISVSAESLVYGNAANTCPQFDLLTSGYSNWGLYSGAAVRDRDLYIRFLGLPNMTLASWQEWRMILYMYRNKNNKKYKKICEIPFSDMKGHYADAEYQTYVFPLSLCRILWERFDFTTAVSDTFHRNEYDWSVCLAHIGYLHFNSADTTCDCYGNAVSKHANGKTLFSGTFGLRVANHTRGIYGEMKTFKVAVIDTGNKYRQDDGTNASILHFIIKMHRGVTTMP